MRVGGWGIDGAARRPPKDQSSLSLKGASFRVSAKTNSKNTTFAKSFTRNAVRIFTIMPHSSPLHAMLAGDFPIVASMPGREVKVTSPQPLKPLKAG